MASLIKRSNGYFHLITYLNGKRIWQSTGATTKSGALHFLEDKKRKSKQCKNLKLSQFKTQYLSFARVNLAPSTVTLYTGAITSFMKSVGDRLLVEYTPQMIEQFKISHHVYALKMGEIVFNGLPTELQKDDQLKKIFLS